MSTVYQKARILENRQGAYDDEPLLRPLAGLEVWIRAEPPQPMSTVGTLSGRRGYSELFVFDETSALEIARRLELAKPPFGIDRDGVELLGEFKEEP